jgi:hypothetical protein
VSVSADIVTSGAQPVWAWVWPCPSATAFVQTGGSNGPSTCLTWKQARSVRDTFLPDCRPVGATRQHTVERGIFVCVQTIRQRYRHSPTGDNGRSSPLPLPLPALIELGISHQTRPKWPDSRNHSNLVTWLGMAGTASPRRPCRNGSVPTFFPCFAFLAQQESRAFAVLHCITALAHPKK